MIGAWGGNSPAAGILRVRGRTGQAAWALSKVLATSWLTEGPGWDNRRREPLSTLHQQHDTDL